MASCDLSATQTRSVFQRSQLVTTWKLEYAMKSCSLLCNAGLLVRPNQKVMDMSLALFADLRATASCMSGLRTVRRFFFF